MLILDKLDHHNFYETICNQVGFFETTWQFLMSLYDYPVGMSQHLTEGIDTVQIWA